MTLLEYQIHFIQIGNKKGEMLRYGIHLIYAVSYASTGAIHIMQVQRLMCT